MPDTDIQLAPFKRLPAEIAVEPIYNLLNSLALLNETQRHAETHEWVGRTAAALTTEQARLNRLLFQGLRPVLEPDQDWPDFPAYLEHLARQNPYTLRDRALERLAQAAPGNTPRPATLLADRLAYTACVEQHYPGAVAGPALYAEAHALLNDPPALHDLIVAHLEAFWEAELAAEWGRATRGRSGTLQHQVQVFQQCLDPMSTAGAAIAPHLRPDAATAEEAFRTCTGRVLPAGLRLPTSEIQRIILVPSPHNGHAISTWYSDGTLRVFFGAPRNYATLQRSSQVGLAELRIRLNALADDVRLRILELIARHGELSAQEIITRLELTQSAVSRHLKQLSPYLFERRGEGANKLYSLNAIEYSITIRTLERLLAGETAFTEAQPQEERADQPEALQRFLDAEGRIAYWPAKPKEQELLIAYLATKFEVGRFYTEKEVNELLALSVAGGNLTARHNRADLGYDGVIDFATLRRSLYNHHFLNRERDGSRYWRNEQSNMDTTSREW